MTGPDIHEQNGRGAEIAAIDRAMAFALGDNLFADAIERMWNRCNRSIIVGLSGAQGSGKSTMAARLATRLRDKGLSVMPCALDDFYLQRSDRLRLAKSVHPLMATRGVPGTHDMTLLHAIVNSAIDASNRRSVAVPRFDKAADDRLPLSQWPKFAAPADVVLIEGWCIGARPQQSHALAEPVNTLERNEDAEGTWRRFVNDRLADEYAAAFSALDLVFMLRAPSFAYVHGWRAEQESGLPRSGPDVLPPMDDEALRRFVSHYERITSWMLSDEPADLIADIDAARVPFGWRVGNGFRPRHRRQADLDRLSRD